jgi:hypothetical protein
MLVHDIDVAQEIAQDAFARVWASKNTPSAEVEFRRYLYRAGLHGTSQALAPGQSAAQWLSAYLTSAGANCGTQEHVPVGGQIGVIDGNGCASDPSHGGYVGRIYDVAVVADGRGYNFAMEGEVDHAFFLAVLATVTFTPQTATDANPVSSP